MNTMSCTVCGNRDFTTAAYRMEGCLAPALECRRCGALNLSEGAAHSQEERDSVQVAIATRIAIRPPPPDGDAVTIRPSAV